MKMTKEEAWKAAWAERYALYDREGFLLSEREMIAMAADMAGCSHEEMASSVTSGILAWRC